MNEIPHELIEAWISEDLGKEDITSKALIPEDCVARARVVARQAGTICGAHSLLPLIQFLGGTEAPEYLMPCGTEVKPGREVAIFEANYRRILALERTYLNLLQRLSGIATWTRHFVDAVKGTSAKIYDTRKTTPGLRLLEKYAVKVGGGENHRMGLYDQFLIKENHVAFFKQKEDPIASSIQTARKYSPDVPLIVEVRNHDECLQALNAKPDVILLDNMQTDTLRSCVELRNQHGQKIELEASGGVTLENIRSVAETGVDRISIGALTHSAPNLDMSLLIDFH